MICIRKHDSKHGQVIPIQKPAIQVWNGNETGEELQYGQGEGRSGGNLAHALKDVRKVVRHGGLELEGAEVEGGHTGVCILADQA